jgi:hypothetical protein
MPYEGSSDGRHYWLTPPELMAELQERHGFTFDACPYPRPEGFDGLTVDWGESTYVNPPFKGPTAWIRKAIAENQKGKRVVIVFPLDKWVLMLLNAGATVRNLRDVKWCATEDGQPGKGTGRWIAEFVLEPKDPCEPSDGLFEPELDPLLVPGSAITPCDDPAPLQLDTMGALTVGCESPREFA